MPLTYKLVEQILKDLWFRFDHKKGSHGIRYKEGHHATVPHHKEFRKGTAANILKQIATASNKEVKELIQQYNIKL